IIWITGSQQSGYFVHIVREVETEVPSELVGVNHTRVEGEFNTLVFKGAHIRPEEIGKVTARRDLDIVQKVFGLALVYIEGTRDPVFQQSKVDTRIVGCGFFPFDVAIISVRALRVVESVAKLVAGRVGAGLVHGEIRIGAVGTSRYEDILLPCNAITRLDLMV